MSGGYSAVPGLYRVPDLLTEEQFKKYMKDVYNAEVTFNHPDVDSDSDEVPVTTLVAERALGQSRPMGVINEDGRPVDVVDPVLLAYNSAEAVQTSTDRRAEEVRIESEDTEESEDEVEDPTTVESTGTTGTSTNPSNQ